MAALTSMDVFQVITPVLSQVAPIRNDSRVKKISVQADRLRNKKYNNNNTVNEGSLEAKTNSEPVETARTDESAGDPTGQGYGKDTTSNIGEITINGDRYVEALRKTHSYGCIINNGVRYILQDLYRKPKTAYGVLDHPDLAGNSEASQEGLMPTRFVSLH